MGSTTLYDVIIYDSVGSAIDWSRPLGGTEAGHVLLASALRDEGLSVRVMRTDEQADCRALILSRWSRMPSLVTFNRAIVMAHDLWRREYLNNHDLDVVCVSDFQRRSFDFGLRWALEEHDIPRIDVIRPILGDHVRRLKSIHKVAGRWIYPTAANKGLKATLRLWRELKGQNGFRELIVTSSGYDEPPPGICAYAGAEWIGPSSPEDLALQIARSEGLFYVNTAPECFPMTVAIARELGCTMSVRCEGHDACGIAEALEEHDLRPATIARSWMARLRLG